MSPVNQLSVLAFAAGALAIPQWGGHGHHQHHHHSSGAGAASASGTGVPFPYPGASNSTLFGTTGTGFATGVAPSSSGVKVITVSPVPASVTASSASSSASTYADVAASSAAEAVASSGVTTCTTDVTVTSTQRTYVTVTLSDNSTSAALSTTAGPSTSHTTVQSTVYLPSSSVSSASSDAEAAATSETSSAAPTLSSSYSAVEKHITWQHRSSAASSAPAPSSYVAPTTSSAAAPSSSSVEAAPASTSETSSTYVAPSSSYVAPSSSYVVSTTTSSSSAAASSTAASAPSSGRGKRGLAYNDASLTSCYMDSPHVSWAFNWGSSSSGLASGKGVNYIPLLWSTRSDFTSGWSSNAQSAIDAGSEYLFSFNEPDLSTQANMSPQDAAAAYKQYMQPFAGKAKLCAPAVTNGGGAMGLTWLQNFLDACDGCTIDCLNIHWYEKCSNTQYFKDQVTNATTMAGGNKPVFVSEFGTTDGTSDDVSTFLKDVMPWMDSNDKVAGYAYFMVKDGLLNSGSEPSGYGNTYATYSG